MCSSDLNHMNSPILAPVVVLVAWSMVMWTWMYATRLPAMIRLKMKSDPFAPRGEQMNSLPARVRWKADNYNHLFEQPTLFYAVALGLAALGRATAADVTLCWAYVGSRVVHSIFQATVNRIEVRFVLFILSSLLLLALSLRLALAVF